MVGNFLSKESGILLIGSVYLHVCNFEATSIDSKWFAGFKSGAYFQMWGKLGQHAGFVRAMRGCTSSYVCAFVTFDIVDRIRLAICNSVSPFCSCEYDFLVALKPEWFWTDSCRGGSYGSLWGLMVIPPVQPIDDVHKPLLLGWWLQGSYRSVDLRIENNLSKPTKAYLEDHPNSYV